MNRETIFDGMTLTKTQCKNGLENFMNCVLNGFTLEDPKSESVVNQVLTYYVRTVERAIGV